MPLLSLFLLSSPPPFIRVSAADRSIDPRSIALQERDPGSGFNVGHRGKCRTHVRVSPRSARNATRGRDFSLFLIYCRSLERGYYNSRGNPARVFVKRVFCRAATYAAERREKFLNWRILLFWKHRQPSFRFCRCFVRRSTQSMMQSRCNSSRSYRS